MCVQKRCFNPIKRPIGDKPCGRRRSAILCSSLALALQHSTHDLLYLFVRFAKPLLPQSCWRLTRNEAEYDSIVESLAESSSQRTNHARISAFRSISKIFKAVVGPYLISMPLFSVCAHARGHLFSAKCKDVSSCAIGDLMWVARAAVDKRE